MLDITENETEQTNDMIKLDCPPEIADIQCSDSSLSCRRDSDDDNIENSKKKPSADNPNYPEGKTACNLKPRRCKHDEY